MSSVPDAASDYVQRTGNLLFFAGKGPRGSTGTVSAEVRVEQTYQGSGKTGLILLAVLRTKLGTFARVTRIAKVFGMVNVVPDFGDPPKVSNDCSDLSVEVFGDPGRHTRTPAGMGSLRRQIIVEIESIIEVTG